MTTSQVIPDPETKTMKIAGQTALAISAQHALERARQHVDSTGIEMASGDRAQFERLIKKHLQPATQLALRLTGEWNAAEDLVQETMLKAVRNWETFRSQSQFKTWLFRIMINAFRDRLRKQKRTNEHVESNVDTVEPASDLSEVADASAQVHELGEVVASLIAKLPERQREVIVLSTYQSLTSSEIAEALEISIANVHSTLSAARKKLKQQLAPYFQ